MNNDLFADLGLPEPWFVAGLAFDEGERLLTVSVDFRKGSWFPYGEGGAAHPVHDTRTRRYRHLNFLLLKARTPRVRLHSGQVAAAVGRPAAWLHAPVRGLGRVALPVDVLFATVAGLSGLSWHEVAAVCERYVELALERADFSDVDALAIDETSRAKGHDYVTVTADAHKRCIVGVEEGCAAAAVEGVSLRGGKPDAVASASIDMSPAFIKGVSKNPPNTRTTFDKIHIIRKQVNVERGMLRQRRIDVNRSKVEPVKAVAKKIQVHLEGIVAWTQTRQTNGFVEAISGLFQAAKRKARDYRCPSTLRTVFFLIAGKLNLIKVNPHAA